MKEFISQDLGDHTLRVSQVFNYETDSSNLLVLTDDRADGLVHVYYGPSLHEAKQAIREALGDDADQVISDLVNHMTQY
jgi:hypothetical protein